MALAFTYMNFTGTSFPLHSPLFAIGKQIQWTWPDIYGEDKFILVLGGLHIEMAMVNVLGDWLEGSGWVPALTEADIFTQGRAEAVIKGSHITRARYAHQVSASVLHLLLEGAYQTWRETRDTEEEGTFADWCEHQCKYHPQFKYWATVLELELLYLQYVHSLRTADFPLYTATLESGSICSFVLLLQPSQLLTVVTYPYQGHG